MHSLINLVSVGLVVSSSLVSALNPIIVQGNAFFDSVTNERFYIRGVDYQVPFVTQHVRGNVLLIVSLVAVLL